MTDPSGDLGDALYRLAELLLTESNLSADLERTAAVVVASIPGCDAATISLVLEGTPRTVAASDRVVLQVDLAQYAADSGPCLDSARTGEGIAVDFVPGEERYAHLVPAAQEAGVTAIRSHPVVLHDRPIGSLNLYTREPDGFPEAVGPEGDVLAAQVAVALEKSRLLGSATEVVEEVGRTADQRASLAQATGVLMAVHHCSAEQAARLIANASDTEQRSVGEVVALILSSLESSDHPLLDSTATDVEAQRRDVDTGSSPPPPTGRREGSDHGE